MAIDFNDAKPQGYYSSRQLDDPYYVEKLKIRMNDRAEEILRHIWPSGEIRSGEYLVGDVRGAPGESLKVSLRQGKIGLGADFAGNETCRDLIDCWSWATYGRSARGTHFMELCERIEEYLGAPFRTYPPHPRWARQDDQPAAEVKRDKPRSNGEDLGAPTATYAYTDADNNVLVLVRRYDKPGGGKEFRPWNAMTRQHRMPEGGRPLYNQTGIKDEEHVVFVEGEKAVDALTSKGVPATCAMGGSKAPVDKTDWSPLRGKHVIVWPDADEPGRKFAAVVAQHLNGGGGRIVVMDPPAGKEGGWDAADAVAEGLEPAELLKRAWIEAGDAPAAGERRTLRRWRLVDYTREEPRPVQWLVEDAIPLGVAGLLVAMGHSGKGMLALDLALKVARTKDDGGLLGEAPRTLGGRVLAEGSVVVLAAQDDAEEINRRVHGLDPAGDRFRLRHDLYVVPVPSEERPFRLFVKSPYGGVAPTRDWEWLVEELVDIPDLRLVVIDPLQAFVDADINGDSAAGSHVVTEFSHLASRLGATVLVAHHMRKVRGGIAGPEEAREAIRGTSALVDDVRFALAMWPTEISEAKKVCAKLGEDHKPGKVFQGAVVKSNAPASMEVRTFVRDPANGLLRDRTAQLHSLAMTRAEMLRLLEERIADAAGKGQPFQHTNSQGLFANRHRLGPELENVSRHDLEGMARELLHARRIVKAAAPGEKRQAWLDVPKGPFAKGVGEFAEGWRD